MAEKHGLLIPFQRAQAQDFAAGGGSRLTSAKIRQVLGTSPGELPWRTSFGAGLEALRHQANDVVLAELARVRARDALETWIGGLVVENVTVARDGTEVAITIRVRDLVTGETAEATV